MGMSHGAICSRTPRDVLVTSFAVSSSISTSMSPMNRDRVCSATSSDRTLVLEPESIMMILFLFPTYFEAKRLGPTMSTLPCINGWTTDLRLHFGSSLPKLALQIFLPVF